MIPVRCNISCKQQTMVVVVVVVVVVVMMCHFDCL